MSMKKTLPLFLGLFVLVGCGSGNGPAYGEDVTAKIKAMPAEERYKLIRDNPGLSPQMKSTAIDELPVSDDQKQKWKAEANASTAGAAAPTNR